MSHPAPRISPFGQIRHTDDGEYWSARELAKLLDYTKWNNFVEVIQKARLACETSGHQPSDHFAESGKMIAIGSTANRYMTPQERVPNLMRVQQTDAKIVRENITDADAAGQAYF